VTYWFEIGAYVLLSITFATLLILIIKTSYKVRQLSVKLIKSEVDNAALREKLAELMTNGENRKLEETEGFVKFISQSRDWAFQYIEKVQIAIKNFQDVFHPFAVQYYEKKKTRITKEEFQTIVDAYKELVDRLPEEGKKK
jgi:hypothetical protein